MVGLRFDAKTFIPPQELHTRQMELLLALLNAYADEEAYNANLELPALARWLEEQMDEPTDLSEAMRQDIERIDADS